MQYNPFLRKSAGLQYKMVDFSFSGFTVQYTGEFEHSGQRYFTASAVKHTSKTTYSHHFSVWPNEVLQFVHLTEKVPHSLFRWLCKSWANDLTWLLVLQAINGKSRFAYLKPTQPGKTILAMEPANGKVICHAAAKLPTHHGHKLKCMNYQPQDNI